MRGSGGPEPASRRGGPTGVTRRQLLIGVAGTAGLAGAAGVAAWAGGLFDDTGDLIAPTDPVVRRVEAGRVRAGAGTVAVTLSPRPVALDLGGPLVSTWGYADTVPGPLIRARAGDLVRATVVNGLPDSTSVHWHGIALRNDMDGVPGLTQAPIVAGARHTYEFTAPDPGTYFYHPHTGVQLDRALYGVLIVDDPHESGRYDTEWVVVLDDWVDGTGRRPDDVLAGLQRMSGMHDGGGMMNGMSGGGMHMMTSPLLGGAGDVVYPHYLINGRVPAAPVTLTGKPGQRARIRLVNAASDTAFRVALGGHRFTVTHTDGFAVTPTDTDAVLLGMGERVDVVVRLAEGVFRYLSQCALASTRSIVPPCGGTVPV